MKIRESRLRRVIRKVIIENENNGDNGDDDFDIYQSFDSEPADAVSDFDFSDEESQANFDSGSKIRERTILQKFCDQFGIPEEYITEFLRTQAFHGGLDGVPVNDQGEDLDDSVKN